MVKPPANFPASGTVTGYIGGVVPNQNQEEIGGAIDFSYASIDFFSVDKLTPKGPRANADVGEPHDSSRPLVKVGPTSAGSWWCEEGGWPSPAKRATTEVFYVLSGRGYVSDEDGQRHHFGPGDTVVLPKGWSGRWDILEAIHKVWFVHDHPRVEETSSPIRAVITPYSNLVIAPGGSSSGVAPSTASRTIYDVGPTEVGCLTCTPGSFPVFDLSKTEGFHVLEGVFFLTSADGTARRCVAGDTVVLPKGWTGHWDVVETVRSLRVVAEETAPRIRKPIVGGNWKCNPVSASDLPELVRNFDGCADHLEFCDVYVCPSNLHVGLVKDDFAPGISVAPQNCNFAGCGAYTGEMAVDQIKDMGMSTVLLGHSERRGEFGLPTPAESNQLMATKLQYALDHGLRCVFCIGEPLPVRERGIDAVLAECVSQLQDIVPILRDLEDKERVVIAYEPVWAIGTGVTASPQQAQETHRAIRDWIARAVDRETADGIRIQYGGSANAENAPELAACPDIDGFLVGGASLKPDIVDIVAAMAR